MDCIYSISNLADTPKVGMRDRNQVLCKAIPYFVLAGALAATIVGCYDENTVFFSLLAGADGILRDVCFFEAVLICFSFQTTIFALSYSVFGLPLIPIIFLLRGAIAGYTATKLICCNDLIGLICCVTVVMIPLAIEMFTAIATAPDYMLRTKDMLLFFVKGKEMHIHKTTTASKLVGIAPLLIETVIFKYTVPLAIRALIL